MSGKIRKYRKRLTPESNYDCAIRTKEILDGCYEERDKQIAELFGKKGMNAYQIARLRVLRKKRGRGFVREDTVQKEINRLYAGLIQYDEKHTDQERSHNSQHIMWCQKTKAMLLADGRRCAICGSGEDLELDHITPYGGGGKDEIENVQILCHKCHAEKSVKERAQMVMEKFGQKEDKQDT